MDYRALNNILIKNKYPLLLILETLNKLNKAVIFTKLNIISAFNRIRIVEGQEQITAFKIKYRLFKSLILLFRLYNKPSTFQAYINNQLKNIFDDFYTAYIDDILIFSNSKKEHKQHVKEILRRLQDANLQYNITKCAFNIIKILYLSILITKNEVKIDPAKVTAIKKQPELLNIHDIRYFLGFTNFYRRFIKKFLKIA